MSVESKTSKLQNAIFEAERFIDRAHFAMSRFHEEKEDDFHSASFAAAKRSSMDLTRALAELRKP